MAPVFSLFTHANEQDADEQTWAQPPLPAAQGSPRLSHSIW